MKKYKILVARIATQYAYIDVEAVDYEVASLVALEEAEYRDYPWSEIPTQEIEYQWENVTDQF